MKILLKLMSLLVSLVLSFTIIPHTGLQPAFVYEKPESDKILTRASIQGSMASPVAQEISNNGAFAAVITVPPVIRVANAGYGLNNQSLTSADSSTIQTQLIDYSARSMQSYNTTISVTVPSGATAPVLTATTQGAGSINLAAVDLSGNPYTWQITGGTAVAGNYIDYTITYNLNGRQYTQKAASYIDYVELAAGWQTYVVRRNFSNVTHTRHEYTATLSGSGSTGAGYAVYGGGGTGNYNLTGGGSSGFIANSTAFSGMKLWDPGYDARENVEQWYCGQSGEASDDNGDGGHRTTLDIYYDPSIVTNISQLGIKLLYRRSTSPEKISALAQEKMIYLQGNSRFSNGSSSDTTAQSYFYSTNAQNNRSQSITTDPGNMTFNFAGTALPPDGQQVTFASAIYGKYQTQVDLTTWNAWLITFHVVNKAALRSLIATEDTAFRQIHDGYTNTGGAFTAYLNQLTKAKAVLNQPNATPAQISAAVSNLSTAKNNFTYMTADYVALNNTINSIYNPTVGFRPSITNDPDYYFADIAGINYYPSSYYIDTTGLEATLAGVIDGLDIRYQAYVDTTLAEINTVWRTLVLLDADYTTVNDYINTNTISGQNDATGSPAGNYILANATKYPQYASQMIYWRHFTLSSYNDWDTAVKGATLGLKIPDEAEVAAIGTALESAYNNLTIQPPDYTELNVVMADTFTAINQTVYVENPAGGGHNITYYSVASINAMQGKRSEIVDGLDGLLMPEQGMVITWSDQLLALYNAKTLNNADYQYASAQKTISVEFEAEAPVYYTTDSWQTLTDARNAVVPGKRTDEQSVVNEWATNIYDARNALVLNSADYSAIDSALSAASSLTPANYQNWPAVADAIDAVVYGLDITHQNAVDGYAEAIEAAIENLIYLDADYSAVDAAIIAADLLTPANYQNWSAVADAIDAIVYGLDITQQIIVDGYAEAITTAIESLLYLDADLTALNAAIDTTAAYIEGVYTPGSWAVFADALAAGIAIRDALPATNFTQQSAVDTAAAAIDAAAELLVEAFVGIEVNLSGSTVADEETGYIYGLPASGDLFDLTTQGYINVIGSGHFAYTPFTGYLGTGTKVELIRDADSKVMAVYTIIIFGDIDGDGLADGRDACIADMLANGMLTQNDVGDAAYLAADANHDGLVDSADALLLEQAGLFFAQINQN